MIIYPNSIKKSIESFKLLPGIGDKTAERLTFSLLNVDKEKLTDFAQSLMEIRDNITRCKFCNNICEGEICNICNNDSRQKNIIFVVENPKDVVLFEKIGAYNGLYHVLDGLISPLDGVNPEDIKVEMLLERIKKENVVEVIFALKPSIEGETTMQYILKLFENINVKVSKIASGIPIGAEMEYLDSLTLEMALEERKYLS